MYHLVRALSLVFIVSDCKCEEKVSLVLKDLYMGQKYQMCTYLLIDAVHGADGFVDVV